MTTRHLLSNLRCVAAFALLPLATRAVSADDNKAMLDCYRAECRA